MKYFIHDRSFAHLCVYLMFALALLSSASEVSAYGYSQGSYSSYSYGQGSYYSQGSYSSYSYGQSSYYSQSSYSSYSYGQSSYYSQSSYSSSYSQGSYSSYSYGQGSYSSGLGYSSGSSGGGSSQESCTWLCGVVKTVTDGIINTPKAVVDAGKAVVDAVNGSLGIKPAPSYTTLPSGNTADKPEPVKSGNETPAKPSGGTYSNIPNTSNNNGGTVTTVTKPDVFTDTQEAAREAARQAGLNVNSPAVEAVVMLTLEKYNGDVAKTVAALKDVPNDAITNEVAFGRTGCSANDSQCAAAEKVRDILGLDAASYQRKLAEEMQEIDSRRTADPIVVTTPVQAEASYAPTDKPATNKPSNNTNTSNTNSTYSSGSNSNNNTTNNNNAVVFNPDLTGMFGDGLPTTLTPPKLTTDLFTNEEFKDVKLAAYDESKVITVPAKTVKAFDVYDTEKVRLNPATHSFVSDDEYEETTLSAKVFTDVKDDLKAILPTTGTLYGTHYGIPVMSPGELALVGKFDFSQGGKYDAEAEKKAIELALRGEIPADVRARIEDGTATAEDMIELTGIMTVLINRSVSTRTSIYEQATAECQFTAVSGCNDVPPSINPANVNGKLLEAVYDLADGTYAQEFGLNTIEPDELAYAAHYYNPSVIGKPAKWDINFDLPHYESAGGHLFGNVNVKNSPEIEYSVAGLDIPLDYGVEEETVVLTYYNADEPLRLTTTPLETEIETAEERIKRQYQEYAAGRIAARDALKASAEVAQEQIQKNCGSTCTVEIVSKGTAAGVNEFQVEITTQGDDLTQAQKDAIASAASRGVDVSDPDKKALVITLLGDSTLEEFNKTLDEVQKQTADIPNALNRLADDLINGTNTVEKDIVCLFGCIKANVTEELRKRINEQLVADGQKPVTAEEMAASIQAEAERIASLQNGTTVNFADLTKEEQEKYLGIAYEELQVAQKAAQDEVYVAYEETHYKPDETVPVVETASDNCGFICNAMLSPFGGIEGARKMLERAAADTGVTSPVQGVAIVDNPGLNDEFADPRPGGREHAGVDIYADIGTPVVGVMDGGVVVRSDINDPTGYGNVIDIQYPDGTVHRMAHLDSRSVKVGDTVNAGDVVGTVGRTGIESANIGSHTHYEIIKSDAYKNGVGPVYTEEALNNGRLDPTEYFSDTVVLTDSQQDVADRALDLFNKTFPKETTVVLTDADDNNDQTPSTPDEEPQTIGEAVGEVVDTVVNTVADFVTGIFKPSGKTPTVTDSLVESDNDSDDNGNNPDPVEEPEPELTIDLTAKATAPSQSNANEYRFRGDLTRVYSRDQSYAELQKFFSVTLENKLNIDYSCDGSVDAVKTFTIPYRTFAWSNKTSTVLLSEYMQVSTSGSHCFWFEVDTKNALKEVDENNNASNKHNFTI